MNANWILFVFIFFFINLILSCILGLEFVYFAIKLLEILKEITWRGWNKYGYYDLIIDLVGVLMSRSKRNCLFFVAYVAIQIVYCGNRKKKYREWWFGWSNLVGNRKGNRLLCRSVSIWDPVDFWFWLCTDTF